MSEKLTVGKLTVRSKGNFSVKEFYSHLHQFFMDKGYVAEEGGKDYIEKYYFQEDTQNGKMIKFEWVGKNDTEKEVWTPQLKLYAEIKDLVDVEKVVNNKKVVTNFADVKVKLEAYITEDPKPKSGQLKSWFPTFKAGYMEEEYDQLEEGTMDDLLDLHELIKQILNLSA